MGAACSRSDPGSRGSRRRSRWRRRASSRDAVVDNLFGRFFAGTSHARPFYYYLYQLPLGLPALDAARAGRIAWAARRSVFVARRATRSARAWRFLLAWVRRTLVFFSLSSGKRGLYLLPAFPALALLLADALCR